MSLAVLILFFVLLLIVVRRLGPLRFPMWVSMTIGAAAVLLLGQISFSEAFYAVSWDVIFFLLGMFIIGAAIELSGILNVFAEKSFQKFQTAKSFLLFFIFFAGFLSALLMNDTVAVIFTPFSMLCAYRFKISPKILLFALAASVTTGCLLSPIGAPQNLIIATKAFDGSFIPFFVYLAIPTLLSLFVLYFYLSILIKSECNTEIKNKTEDKTENEKNKTESKTGNEIKSKIENKIESKIESKIENEIKNKIENNVGNKTKNSSDKAADFFPSCPVSEIYKDPSLFKLTKISIAIVIILISASVLFSLFWKPIPLVFISFVSAVLLLFFSKRRFELLKKVDWETLIFFISMFVLIESVNMTGFFQNYIPSSFGTSIPVLYSTSLILSQIISNVPYVSLALPLLENMSATSVYYITLLAGSTLAGNLTVFGAASNIIIIQNAEKSGETLTFFEFLKFGFPIVLIQSIIFIGWLILISVLRLI